MAERKKEEEERVRSYYKKRTEQRFNDLKMSLGHKQRFSLDKMIHDKGMDDEDVESPEPYKLKLKLLKQINKEMISNKLKLEQGVVESKTKQVPTTMKLSMQDLVSKSIKDLYESRTADSSPMGSIRK